MSLANFGVLEGAGAFWESRGFHAWSQGTLGGVYRRMTVRKSSMLGEVARYFADDYVFWRHGGERDRDLVLRTWGPARDLMVQRVVFLEEGEGVPARKARGFLLGLRGYLEVYRFCPGGKCSRGMNDLSDLIGEAYKYVSPGSGLLHTA